MGVFVPTFLNTDEKNMVHTFKERILTPLKLLFWKTALWDRLYLGPTTRGFISRLGDWSGDGIEITHKVTGLAIENANTSIEPARGDLRSLWVEGHREHSPTMPF